MSQMSHNLFRWRWRRCYFGVVISHIHSASSSSRSISTNVSTCREKEGYSFVWNVHRSPELRVREQTISQLVWVETFVSAFGFNWVEHGWVNIFIVIGDELVRQHFNDESILMLRFGPELPPTSPDSFARHLNHKSRMMMMCAAKVLKASEIGV